MLHPMRTLLLVVLAFAAGFYADRWQHRPIVITLKPATHPAQEVIAPRDPRSPVYWEGGGGHFEHNDWPCTQPVIHCWWVT
jgi:hypothetical protein